MSADPLAIARDLLRCRSVTPAEGGALAYLEGVLKAAGFTVHRMTFSEPGADDVENLYARIGRRRAQSGVRRAYRRGAAGRREGVEASAVRRHGRRQPALWPRRGRHEGRHRLRGRRRARSSRGQWRQTEGLDLVPDHRRRGRHRGQRHAQAFAVGGRARRKIRSLHPGRTEQPGRARRHHQDRPARLAQRPSDRHRPARPCRLSAARRQSDPRAGDAGCGAAGRAARRRQRAVCRPRIWNSPRSMSATRPSTSFPARRARASTSASTIATRSTR